MSKRIGRAADWLIFWGYFALFFVAPLIVIPWTSELFEFNKMFFVYGVTIVVVAAWLVNSAASSEMNFFSVSNSPPPFRRIARLFFSSSNDNDNLQPPRNSKNRGGLARAVEAAKESYNESYYKLGFIKINKTPLDIPILLFLGTQILATVFSIDRYVSIWGYYSRQNGGLLSTISYIVLYYAFVSYAGSVGYVRAKNIVRKLLKIGLAGGLVVAGYGVLQHFGIDRHLWVQDVQNRVFSTLGQPNWLAAYMGVLSFIAMGIGIGEIYSRGDKGNKRDKGSRVFRIIRIFRENLLLGLVAIFYLTILYTKSRSGLIGFWGGSVVFLGLSYLGCLRGLRVRRKIGQVFLGLYLALLGLTFFVGVPEHIINRGSQGNQKDRGSKIASGGTESGEIRKYVWQGAVNAWRASPIVGTGVETFAWAFYKYKPVGHNNTSEWDFLYNKAHNEYLNYLATTGILGLLGYLGIIGSFVWWFVKKSKVKSQKSKPQGKSKNFLALNYNFEFCALSFALFAAWVSILITNFFGFSTVVTSLYFWLVPGMVFVIQRTQIKQIKTNLTDKSLIKSLATGIIILVAGILLFTLGRFWYADVLYARGRKLVRSDFANKGKEILEEAVTLRPGEPMYWDELGYSKALLAIDAFEREEASRASELVEEALENQAKALKISPQNLSFLKTRVRIYYLFSQMNSEFIDLAIKTLRVGRKLAPNDPKILYNLGLLYSSGVERTQIEQMQTDGTDNMMRAIELIEKALKLKPNYRDARIGLGLLYRQEGEIDKARRQFKFVLQKINSQDQEAARYLKDSGNF